MRKNVYKDKIVQILKRHHLLSIADVHQKLSDVDYSTVYRNIQQLVSDGAIQKIVLDKDTVMYEIAGDEDSHDHFVCLECGRVEAVEKMSLQHAALNRCVVTDVLFKGLCYTCR